MSNKAKSEFLGMSHGTACNQLRKRILFSLVVAAGLDDCFQCSSKIESVDDLSIEHKKPWFGESTELVWDLANIAFSHLDCNSRARRVVLKTHCVRGHEYTPENTADNGRGDRKCRACDRERWHRDNRAQTRRQRRRKIVLP